MIINKGLKLNDMACKYRLGGTSSQPTSAWKRWIGPGLLFLIRTIAPKFPPPRSPIKLESTAIKAHSTGIGVVVKVGVGVTDGVWVWVGV